MYFGMITPVVTQQKYPSAVAAVTPPDRSPILGYSKGVSKAIEELSRMISFIYNSYKTFWPTTVLFGVQLREPTYILYMANYVYTT